MNLDELAKFLAQAGIPSRFYSLNGEDKDESMCLAIERGIWVVYLSERGTRNLVRSFQDEPSACQYLYEQLVRSWHVHQQLSSDRSDNDL